MWYLFLQIWVWLVVAFALGWFAHWFFCCRGNDEDDEAQGGSILDRSLNAMQSGASVVSSAPELEISPISDSWKPQGFMEPPEQIDDLKRIKGIGAVLEQTLNELGVYQFTQIAQWNSENEAWVDNFLSFSGRIGREDWISQAETLSSGGTTDFASKVDKGEVDYD